MKINFERAADAVVKKGEAWALMLFSHMKFEFGCHWLKCSHCGSTRRLHTMGHLRESHEAGWTVKNGKLLCPHHKDTEEN